MVSIVVCIREEAVVTISARGRGPGRVLLDVLVARGRLVGRT